MLRYEVFVWGSSYMENLTLVLHLVYLFRLMVYGHMQNFNTQILDRVREHELQAFLTLQVSYCNSLGTKSLENRLYFMSHLS